MPAGRDRRQPPPHGFGWLLASSGLALVTSCDVAAADHGVWEKSFAWRGNSSQPRASRGSDGHAPSERTNVRPLIRGRGDLGSRAVILLRANPGHQGCPDGLSVVPAA